MSYLSTLNTPSEAIQSDQRQPNITHQDTTGRYSLGTPQASRGMRRGHSFPLVRRTFADGCGSLWHNSASSLTRSPTTTSRRPPLSPLVSSGAPRRGLQREKKDQVNYSSRWDESHRNVCSAVKTESLKNLIWSMQTLWVEVTQWIRLCQQAYFSACPSLKLYLCLLCIPQHPAVAVSSVCQSRCGPPRRLTGGDG